MRFASDKMLPVAQAMWQRSQLMKIDFLKDVHIFYCKKIRLWDHSDVSFVSYDPSNPFQRILG